MPSSSPPEWRRHSALVADTVRVHRVAAIAWVLGAGVFMYLMAFSIDHEMKQFPGGAVGLARSVRGSVEAMRPLRWPASRLDTVGGYLWYHNVPLLTLFLAVYAAVQGARAIRGAEDTHSLEEILGAGLSRRAVIRDRAIGFAVIVACIALGIGAATAAGMASVGAGRAAGSFATMLAVGLCALVGYGLGMLLSQFTTSSRGAAGMAAASLAGLYVGTNVAGEIGPFGVVRFVSPFHYANNARAMVPGFGFDLPSALALAVLALGLLVASAWAFDRRDYRASLWRRAPQRRSTRPVVVQRRMLRHVWTATLLRQRGGLVAWSLSGAAYLGMVASLQPSVMKVWDAFSSYAGIAGGRAGIAPAAQYMSLAVELVMPIVAAYVITQASGWVGDLEEGRNELVLATPMSPARLVAEQALAATIGATVVSLASLGALSLTAVGVDAPLSLVGLLRTFVACVLLAAAFTGVSVLVAATLRTHLAVIGLAIFVGGSYLVGLLVAMLDWPAWIARLSIFTSFGHPYLEAPSVVGVVVLGAFALGGGVIAAVAAARSPRLA